jgi:hypothetical protein
MASKVKNRIGQLLSSSKDKDTVYLNEQIELLTRMIHSKEEDLKAKETQHVLMCDFFVRV